MGGASGDEWAGPSPALHRDAAGEDRSGRAAGPVLPGGVLPGRQPPTHTHTHTQVHTHTGTGTGTHTHTLFNNGTAPMRLRLRER